jgi:hypothetical protein
MWLGQIGKGSLRNAKPSTEVGLSRMTIPDNVVDMRVESKGRMGKEAMVRRG